MQDRLNSTNNTFISLNHVTLDRLTLYFDALLNRISGSHINNLTP